MQYWRYNIGYYLSLICSAGEGIGYNFIVFYPIFRRKTSEQ